MILYKAIEKYGIDNFEYEILFSENTTDFNNIKRKLDNLEKQYIKEYNSFVPNGYNQTIGGDAGVLGFKMTDEQKEKISINSHIESLDGRYKIYCFDIIDKFYYTCVSLSCLSKILGIKLYTSQIRYNLVANRYILAKTNEELKNKIEKLKNELQYENHNHLKNNGMFKTKFCDEMKIDLINGMSEKEFCEKYNVCKTSYCNYKKKAINNYKRVYAPLVDKDKFIEYYYKCNKNAKLCSEYFNINIRRVYKYIQKYNLN